MNRGLNKWRVKTSKCLEKVTLGREKVQTKNEKCFVYLRKNREANVERLVQGMMIFLSVTVWLPFIHLSRYAKPSGAIKNIDTTYADTWQNWDIHETHKTFFDFSFMTVSCKKCPSSHFARKTRKFWWGQLEASHFNTTVWLSNHCQFLLLAYLTVANFTTTLIFSANLFIHHFISWLLSEVPVMCKGR